jgi:hypothetical protein
MLFSSQNFAEDFMVIRIVKPDIIPSLINLGPGYTARYADVITGVVPVFTTVSFDCVFHECRREVHKNFPFSDLKNYFSTPGPILSS